MTQSPHYSNHHGYYTFVGWDDSVATLFKPPWLLHLRRLRWLSHHIIQEAMKQLVCSSILSNSTIDNCNSILIGLQASLTAPLQSLQNAAARLVMGLRARDQVTSASLHWLPIHFEFSTKKHSWCCLSTPISVLLTFAISSSPSPQ